MTVGVRVGVSVGVGVGVQVGLDPTASAGSSTTLTVALTDSTDPVITAVNYTYALIVTNAGVPDATLVSAVVTLDASLAFVFGSGTGWVVGAVGQVVTCTRATLATGAAPTVTITVTSGGSALTASTTGDAIAANAPAATQAVQATVVKLVARDATSGIRVPASLTQWQDFNAYHVAIGTANFPNVTPTCLWLCQEASGNLTDTIGGVTLTQSGAGHLYQQIVVGWSRKAVQTIDGTAAQKWINSTTAPNPNTTSTNWFAIVSFPAVAPIAARDVLACTGTLDCRLSTGGKVAIINSGTTNGTANPLAGVHLVEVKHDNTASAFVGYTDQEKIVGGFAAVASAPQFMLGGQTTTASGSAYLYVAEFSGAAAELTDAQHKARQLALGWAPLWS